MMLAGSRHPPERGSGLVIVVLAMMLMAALGSALVLITRTETGISAHYGRAGGLLYAADASLARAAADLIGLADWNAALSGAAVSAFADGGPGGIRLISGARIDLTALTNELRCGRTDACGDADVSGFTAERPWGLDNPRWQLFAWGRLSSLSPFASGAADAYLVVWVGDDAADSDGDPLRDGDAPENPGSGVISLVAHAYGAGGTRRVLRATLTRSRPEPPDVARSRLTSWREVP